MSNTNSELIAAAEVEMESAEKRRTKALSEIKLINATAQQEGRSNLSPEEDARVAELFAAKDRAKDEKAGIAARLASLQQVADEEREAEREAKEVRQTATAKPAVNLGI